jgi:UDPglucose--hexose-1-phosphate uridylyltransferase
VSEYRQDRWSGAWVIVAPERGRRPNSGRVAPAAPVGQGAPVLAARDAACPFCPGNERLLPGILAETPAESAPGWLVRVVPNKYPAVRDAAPPPAEAVPGRPVPGFGRHEVVVETPRHDIDLPELDAAGLGAVVSAYRSRFRELAALPGITSVIVFRNAGRKAGASLRHPHSQIIATGLMPPRFAAAADWARAWHAGRGACPACEDLEAERADGRRLVEATEGFLAVVPYAATGPYEVAIAPRAHQPSFADAGEAEIAEFGALLQRTIRRLDELLDRPAYNFAIESGIAATLDPASSHWRLRIVPTIAKEGGFELASGMAINPSLPEDDAAALRAVRRAGGRAVGGARGPAKHVPEEPRQGGRG